MAAAAHGCKECHCWICLRKSGSASVQTTCDWDGTKNWQTKGEGVRMHAGRQQWSEGLTCVNVNPSAPSAHAEHAYTRPPKARTGQ
eukprot:scaffold17087_cov22-Tisochrysis_lutea.AAC.1